MGSLQIFHAVDDYDIPCQQTEMICRRMLGEGRECIDGSKGGAVLDVKEEGRPRVRFEILGHGGMIFKDVGKVSMIADISCRS